MSPIKSLCILALCAPLVTSGETNLPTLPEAIELFQLETVNDLRRTIARQEEVIEEQQARIKELEEESTSKDAVIDSKTTEIARLRENFAKTIAEEEERCKIEKSQLRVAFAAEISEAEAKYENERTEQRNKSTHELELMRAKLEQCKSSTVYMGNVMLQTNNMTLELQRLVEAQAETIHKANEEIKRQKNSSRICEAAANSTGIQTETIVLLRSSLANALDFPQLNASNLEQLDVAPFMLELMESYNKQAKTIRDLKTLLEKEKAVEEHMSDVAKGLTNLTSAIKTASINLDIVDQQAQVIKSQGKSITQLTPFLRHATDDVVWQQKSAEGTGVESVSTCSCLPRSLDPNKPTPVKIEYHCNSSR